MRVVPTLVTCCFFACSARDPSQVELSGVADAPTDAPSISANGAEATPPAEVNAPIAEGPPAQSGPQANPMDDGGMMPTPVPLVFTLSAEPLAAPSEPVVFLARLTRPSDGQAARVESTFALPASAVVAGPALEANALVCAGLVCTLTLELPEGTVNVEASFTVSVVDAGPAFVELTTTAQGAPLGTNTARVDWLVSRAALSDDFDDPGSLARWTELDPNRHARLEIVAGALHLEPIARFAEHWYRDDRGILLSRRVSGNFFVETQVRTVQRTQTNLGPTAEYNAAGLLVRVPGGSDGNERWLMVNVGMQQSGGGGPGMGREIKLTTPQSPESHSVRYLTAGTNEETLRICRFDNTLFVYQLVQGTWQEASRTVDTLAITSGPAVIPTGAPLRFDATSFASELEVGVMAGNYFDSNDSASPYAVPAGGVYQTLGMFEYVRFGDVFSASDCSAP